VNGYVGPELEKRMTRVDAAAVCDEPELIVVIVHVVLLELRELT
jgi:hypothetical protein